MARVAVVVAICFLITGFSRAKIETRRYYHIQSSDGSFLTVGGDNSGGVKIVTEDNHGTDPRQAFWVGAGESHEISPRAQNYFSTLLVGLEMKSNLVFQQTRSLGARYQWWILMEVGDSKYSVQNARAGLCMTSKGKNTQPYVEICDRSLANQTWTFTSVTRRGNNKPLTLPMN